MRVQIRGESAVRAAGGRIFAHAVGVEEQARRIVRVGRIRLRREKTNTAFTGSPSARHARWYASSSRARRSVARSRTPTNTNFGPIATSCAGNSRDQVRSRQAATAAQRDRPEIGRRGRLRRRHPCNTSRTVEPHLDVADRQFEHEARRVDVPIPTPCRSSDARRTAVLRRA